jgi:hypothetical protein
MGLLGDEAQVQARFGPFGDSATLDARLVHGLRRTYLSVFGPEGVLNQRVNAACLFPGW